VIFVLFSNGYSEGFETVQSIGIQPPHTTQLSIEFNEFLNSLSVDGGIEIERRKLAVGLKWLMRLPRLLTVRNFCCGDYDNIAQAMFFRLILPENAVEITTKNNWSAYLCGQERETDENKLELWDEKNENIICISVQIYQDLLFHCYFPFTLSNANNRILGVCVCYEIRDQNGQTKNSQLTFKPLQNLFSCHAKCLHNTKQVPKFASHSHTATPSRVHIHMYICCYLHDPLWGGIGSLSRSTLSSRRVRKQKAMPLCLALVNTQAYQRPQPEFLSLLRFYDLRYSLSTQYSLPPTHTCVQKSPLDCGQ
ncbi:Hypothetical predicted protein, partial [Drosophila guanche]